MSTKAVANRVRKEVENRQVCSRGKGFLVRPCLKFKYAPAIDEGKMGKDE